MEDQAEEENSRKAEVLRSQASKGPLRTSIGKLSGSSRLIPSDTDFHFFNNFPEFKNHVKEIDGVSTNLLMKIGASEGIFSNPIPFPDDDKIELDDDVETDWLENVNDEIYEKCDASVDEFRMMRKKEEETGVKNMRGNPDHNSENGFQMVYGKKNKKLLGLERNGEEWGTKSVQEVKVVEKVRPKVPFHIHTLPKPQDTYKIIVNNSNQPFEHVWLDRADDGSTFLHPLEKHSVLDFVDKTDEIAKPSPIELTPFTLVEDLDQLKLLAAKLRSVTEFSVDLEHNGYRSFQGLTCLMQISTRVEDFVIDTLKLRIFIGPHLRDVFKNPNKRKVMHGADHDILWLQRDFGIYVCNMFDTGQASRVLKMERNSLEYLLNHICGVTANKEYQKADWRVRPLPDEMIRYAREDTHYLLYIYDVLRRKLLMSPTESESSDALVEVYKRSYDVCTQLYEKELLRTDSYLYIYGLLDADLNARQLAVVSGLCEWRDMVARAEDESTGYILPNRTLIELAKQMPLTPTKLRRILKSKLPYVEGNVGTIVGIIKERIHNAAAFEKAVEYLKERRLEREHEENAVAVEVSELSPPEVPEMMKGAAEVNNIQSDSMDAASIVSVQCKNDSGDIAETTFQVQKKPSRAFGALFGSSAKRKYDTDKKEQEDHKLEQIKSTVALPFHTFFDKQVLFQTVVESPQMSDISHTTEVVVAAPTTVSTLGDMIVLGEDSNVGESATRNSESASNSQSEQPENNQAGCDSDIEGGDEPMLLADLSSSFKKCFPSPAETRNSKTVNKSQSSHDPLHVKPFDYAAALMQVKFGGPKETLASEESDTNSRNRSRRGKSKNSFAIRPQKDEEKSDFPQGRRRQAFPASGNRSATFR